LGVYSFQPFQLLYTGVTSDIKKRVWQHQAGVMEGFSKKYNVHQLVYFENCPTALTAIAREKEIKAWRREKKIRLIEKMNPQWDDLTYAMMRG
jgi:putative endonuclease